jgi:hypothetical protein
MTTLEGAWMERMVGMGVPGGVGLYFLRKLSYTKEHKMKQIAPVLNIMY